MKTITEFSGVLLQRAGEVQRAFRAANPAAAVPEDAQPAPASESTAPSAVASAAPPESDAPAEVPVEAGVEESPAAEPAPAAETAATEASPPEAAEASPAEPPAPVDLGVGPEAEAVGATLEMQGERLSRLMEALDVVGRRVGQVRLVRVLQGENPPQGAQKRGDFYYVVDLAPRPQSPQRDGFESRDGDKRRGPGGRDRGGRPGGPGGARGSGGPPGKGGKFSNDRPPRDSDMREGRGEMPRAGAGWTLTRAPDDRRGRSDEAGGVRRDRRPPRGPRFDARPRPPTGGAGDRPPRGPRLEGGGGRPPFSGGRAPYPERGPGQGRGSAVEAAPGASGPRRGPGPARPASGGVPLREPRNWTGRRRGGWDEPAVPDAEQPAAATGPAGEPSAPPEPPPAPVTENPPSSPGGDAPTDHGSE